MYQGEGELGLSELGWSRGLLLVGMAIFARPADTRPDPTLMGRILPGPFRNRVGYGFKKKKPETGPGFIKKIQTRPETRPV